MQKSMSLKSKYHIPSSHTLRYVIARKAVAQIKNSLSRRGQAAHNRGHSRHGARPVHLIITMIKWIRTSRLPIKNSLSLAEGRRRTTAGILVKGTVLIFTRKVDVRLPGEGNSNSHATRPVHLIITMTKWIRTCRGQAAHHRGHSREGHRPHLQVPLCLFFFTLVTGPRRSLSLKVSDTRVYEP